MPLRRCLLALFAAAVLAAAPLQAQAKPLSLNEAAERVRTLYVAMTRARDELILSHAADYGGARARRVSPFVLEALDLPAAAATPGAGLVPASAEERLASFAAVDAPVEAERGPIAIEAIRKHKAAYLMAVGGAAYLVARAIKGAKVLGFEDLGMEAIYEFEVQDMPVTVAVDATGESVHHTAPLVWKEKIRKMREAEPA